MAVELRCPECKAKLRLPIEPEPDSEIECPKCEHVFPCEENLVHAGSAGDKPRKKADGDEKPKKAAEKADKKPEGEPQPKKRKKKKSKKKKTPPLVIAGIVAGVLMFLGVAGAAVWFFTKKSSSQEMMTYLPDDCNVVFGLNLGHVQKYPEFYKTCQAAFANTGFKKAGDTLAKALGNETIDEVVDYVVQGVGKSGGATVFKTKVEYDPGVLAKIPGAKEYVLNGVKYYTIPDIRELGYPGLRVFGPTNRLVVFCSAVPEDKFRLMLEGNKDNMENTAYVRSGSLGKQTIRGTAWRFTVDAKAGGPRIGEGTVVPPATAGQKPSEEDIALAQEWGSIASGAKGMGVKASVGSREVRGELFVQYDDSETASSKLKAWKEKEWIKDEEVEAPKWFKNIADKSGGGKTAAQIVRDGLSFKSSGDLFIIRTSMETKVVGVGSLVTAFTGQQQGAMGGGMGGSGGPLPGGGGAPMPGGGGVPPMPGGGGVPPKPGGRRRFAPTIPVR
jgi:hypothetical protein